jgi:hypothetical protein
MPFVCQLTRGAAHGLLECIVKCPIIRTMSNETPASSSGANGVQPLRAILSADLRTAMKARDQAAIDTMRCLLAVLDNAGRSRHYPICSRWTCRIARKLLTQSELDAHMIGDAYRRAVTKASRRVLFSFVGRFRLNVSASFPSFANR